VALDRSRSYLEDKKICVAIDDQAGDAVRLGVE
jgi:hypothetical protein